MLIRCTVDEIELQSSSDSDDNIVHTIKSICVTCGQCEYQVEIYGTSEKSIKRGLATLRRECPTNQKNFYSI